MPLIAEIPKAQTSYLPISVTTLRPDHSIGISLYLRESGADSLILYRERGIALTGADLAGLASRGMRTLFVTCDDFDIYQKYLRGSLEPVLADESIPVVNRFSHLNEVVRDVLAESFRRGSTASIVSTCHNIAHKVIDVICRKDAIASELLGVLYHDYQTFTHSANVAYYCTFLARALGISSRADLHSIAVGGMLHDLGKLEISETILNKPGPLTPAERAIVKEHPRDGFVKLCRRSDLSLGQLMIVYQHHERIDGQGYPVGQIGAEIHEWGRMCAVVDVYEALTSNRPYRRALSHKEAVGIMGRDAGRAFDKEQFACWMQTISAI